MNYVEIFIALTFVILVGSIIYAAIETTIKQRLKNKLENAKIINAIEKTNNENTRLRHETEAMQKEKG